MASTEDTSGSSLPIVVRRRRYVSTVSSLPDGEAAVAAVVGPEGHRADGGLGGLPESLKGLTITLDKKSAAVKDLEEPTASTQKDSKLEDMPQCIFDDFHAQASEHDETSRHIFMALSKIIRSLVSNEVGNSTNTSDYIKARHTAAQRCLESAENPSGLLHTKFHFDYFDLIERGKELYGNSTEGWPWSCVGRGSEGMGSTFRSDTQKTWVAFWIDLLQQTPTLFNPRQSPHEKIRTYTFHLDSVPRYLYRVYASNSQGVNNNDFIQSGVWAAGLPERDQDILASPVMHCTGDMIFTHVKWLTRQLSQLVSWTPSLLYATQRAIYQQHHQGSPPHDIKICVIDTSQFPQGQFIRDLPLLELFHQPAPGDYHSDLQNFLPLRTGIPCYNGEHFSQGSMCIKGSRSCTVLFENIKEKGLEDMYPAFWDPRRREKLINAAIDLRAIYMQPARSSLEDLETAVSLAKLLLPQSGGLLEMSIAILALRERKLTPELERKVETETEPLPLWASKPADVTRTFAIQRATASLLDTSNISDMDENQVLDILKRLYII